MDQVRDHLDSSWAGQAASISNRDFQGFGPCEEALGKDTLDEDFTFSSEVRLP
jgi:hypothetical protein